MSSIIMNYYLSSYPPSKPRNLGMSRFFSLSPPTEPIFRAHRHTAAADQLLRPQAAQTRGIEPGSQNATLKSRPTTTLAMGADASEVTFANVRSSYSISSVESRLTVEL